MVRSCFQACSRVWTVCLRTLCSKWLKEVLIDALIFFSIEVIQRMDVHSFWSSVDWLVSHINALGKNSRSWNGFGTLFIHIFNVTNHTEPIDSDDFMRWFIHKCLKTPGIANCTAFLIGFMPYPVESSFSFFCVRCHWPLEMKTESITSFNSPLSMFGDSEQEKKCFLVFWLPPTV